MPDKQHLTWNAALFRRNLYSAKRMESLEDFLEFDQYTLTLWSVELIRPDALIGYNGFSEYFAPAGSQYWHAM